MREKKEDCSQRALIKYIIKHFRTENKKVILYEKSNFANFVYYDKRKVDQYPVIDLAKDLN